MHSLTHSLSCVCASNAWKILPSPLPLCLIQMKKFFLNLILTQASSICSQMPLNNSDLSFHPFTVALITSHCMYCLFLSSRAIVLETSSVSATISLKLCKIAQFLPYIMPSTNFIKVNKITIIRKGKLNLKEKKDTD